MRRSSVLLIAGLVLGLVGAGMVLAYVRDVEAQTVDGEELTVYVVEDSIPAGTSGGGIAGHVDSRQVPKRYVPSDALTSLAAIKDKVALERLDEGDTLRARDFGESGETKGALAIPTGKEAAAVSVTIDGGVGRYPAPGDHVNVYGTFQMQGQGLTRRVLSDVEVLATEPKVSSPATAAGAAQIVYLLAVSPEEAGELVFAKELGSVWLTLLPEGQTTPEVEDVRMDFTARTGSGS